LGQGLITTPAQTMYDLMMKPNQGRVPKEAETAARNLRARVPLDELLEIVDGYGRANARVRAVLDEMRGARRGAE
jgi:hypothetical protein